MHLARITVLKHRRMACIDDSDISDLVQTATIAMIDAAQTWNPLIGHPFDSYAVYCMKKTLSRMACRLRLLVHIPHTHSGAELAKHLKRFKYRDITKGGDLLFYSTVDEAGNAVALIELWDQIKRALTPRQYEAMYAMYGPDGIDSVTDVATLFGVSKQAVSSLLESARAKLLACGMFHQPINRRSKNDHIRLGDDAQRGDGSGS